MSQTPPTGVLDFLDEVLRRMETPSPASRRKTACRMVFCSVAIATRACRALFFRSLPDALEH
jgi:hypothetical protein